MITQLSIHGSVLARGFPKGIVPFGLTDVPFGYQVESVMSLCPSDSVSMVKVTKP